MWDDIAEVRTLAVHPDALGTGLGSAILRELIAQAREMGLKRVFCMTFEEQFFGAHGFEPIEGTPVGADVFAEMLRSHDDGLAEVPRPGPRQAQHPGQRPHAPAPVSR